MYDPLKAKVRVAVVTAAAFLTGLGVVSGLGWTNTSFDFPTDNDPQVSEVAVRPALDLSEAFVNVAEVVTPAVVRIETRRPAEARGRVQQQFDPELFRRFFGPDAVVPEGEPAPHTERITGALSSRATSKAAAAAASISRRATATASCVRVMRCRHDSRRATRSRNSSLASLPCRSEASNASTAARQSPSSASATPR